MSWVRRLGKELLWKICSTLAFAPLGLSSRVRVVFYHPLPASGYIVATNHISHFDPSFISFHFPRPLDWLAMKELFHGPILSRLFFALGMIPVDRGGRDRTSLRIAKSRLTEGRVVGIFPEGGIRHGEASIINGAPLKGGVAVLSELTGAPIVPGVIIGSDRFYNKKNWRPWRPTRVWIGYGPPIASPSREGASREEIEKQLSAAYGELRDRLRAEFAITENDLPHSPQERMAE